MAKKNEKVVLAYSGGLDTSVILPWLKETYGYDVIAFAAELGQGDELAGIKKKALASGAVKCVVKDLRQEFVEEYLWPLLQIRSGLRERVSAGHEHRPAADRQVPGRCGPCREGDAASRTARPARATTRCGSS